MVRGPITRAPPGVAGRLRPVGSPSTVLASDLVPWWFAAAFWVAFVALVVVVARDVRRLGGPRRVIDSIKRALDERLESHDDDSGRDQR